MISILRQTNFLLPSQQGDLAHLGQVHADRIVGPGFRVLLDPGQKVFILLQFLDVGLDFGRRLDQILVVAVINFLQRQAAQALLVVWSSNDFIFKFFKQRVVQGNTPHQHSVQQLSAGREHRKNLLHFTESFRALS